ncbi:uncharacterized protein [Parasteatoda tepidariorum]|uniref:uncharacterized protein n=1 Tax=Parasteatoda tepidariorum TaxID=114398 RepID=UPI0039BD7772
MGKSKDVIEWQKGAIVFGRANGHMVNEVAESVGVSKLTVQRVYKQWCNIRGHGKRRQNCGRKKILHESYRRRVSRLFNQNRFQTGQELLQLLNEDPSQPVSEKTLRRELHAMNILSQTSHARLRVERRPDKAFHPDYVHVHVQAGGGSVMPRGCFSCYGMGSLTKALT